MKNEFEMSLENYEKDFISFQNNLSKLKKKFENMFVAFRNGEVISNGVSIEEVRDKLNSQGIEPSGTVIEFVPKEELHVIM